VRGKNTRYLNFILGGKTQSSSILCQTRRVPKHEAMGGGPGVTVEVVTANLLQSPYREPGDLRGNNQKNNWADTAVGKEFPTSSARDEYGWRGELGNIGQEISFTKEKNWRTVWLIKKKEDGCQVKEELQDIPPDHPKSWGKKKITDQIHNRGVIRRVEVSLVREGKR